MPKPKANHFVSENVAWNRLHAAKKIAAKKPSALPPSWWASGLSREEFAEKWRQRHAEILNAASDGTRSLGRVI